MKKRIPPFLGGSGYFFLIIMYQLFQSWTAPLSWAQKSIKSLAITLPLCLEIKGQDLTNEADLESEEEVASDNAAKQHVWHRLTLNEFLASHSSGSLFAKEKSWFVFQVVLIFTSNSEYYFVFILIKIRDALGSFQECSKSKYSAHNSRKLSGCLFLWLFSLLPSCHLNNLILAAHICININFLM